MFVRMFYFSFKYSFSYPLSHLLQSVFIDDQGLVVEDVDFCKTHMALILREDRTYRLCSVSLPLPAGKVRQ